MTLVDEAGEEMQGMLSGPPPRAAKRWTWIGLGTAALAVVGLGVNQTGVLSFMPEQSLLTRISMVHQQIDTIVASAVEESAFIEADFNILVDSYAHKDKPKKEMSLSALARGGGEHKWPKLVVSFLARDGKGGDLKKQLSNVLDAFVKAAAPPHQRQEIHDACAISHSGASVNLTLVPPRKGTLTREDAQLKQAIKTHKPAFSAELSLARDIGEMRKHEDESLPVAARGIRARLTAVFASALLRVAASMGAPPPALHMMRVWRSISTKTELLYQSVDELKHSLPPSPPLKQLLGQMCGGIPGTVSTQLRGLGDLLEPEKAIDAVYLEGLPYGWEVVFDLHRLDPTALIDACAMSS